MGIGRVSRAPDVLPEASNSAAVSPPNRIADPDAERGPQILAGDGEGRLRFCADRGSPAERHVLVG